MSAIKKIMSTKDDYSALVIRLGLGLVMFPHGAQKFLGWYGGYGFEGTMTHFTQNMGIPAVFAFLAIAAEFFGAIGLIVGALTRIAAFGVGVTMVVAACMVHLDNGFFMNWFGNQPGEGFEYHILAATMALALVIKGGGALSIDKKLAGSSCGGCCSQQ